MVHSNCNHVLLQSNALQHCKFGAVLIDSDVLCTHTRRHTQQALHTFCGHRLAVAFLLLISIKPHIQAASRRSTVSTRRASSATHLQQHDTALCRVAVNFCTAVVKKQKQKQKTLSPRGEAGNGTSVYRRAVRCVNGRLKADTHRLRLVCAPPVCDRFIENNGGGFDARR